jgi:U4/U6.U5 tri-snRNP-associated protein 3
MFLERILNMSYRDDRADRYGGSGRADRDSRYDRNDRYDRYDRHDGSNRDRPRSRSPRRDDRERKEKEPSRRDYADDKADVRLRRDYDRPDNDRYARDGSASAPSGPHGYAGRGRGGFQGRVGFAGRGAYQNQAPGYGRGGYGGPGAPGPGGPGGYRREDYERDRPLDRAAIEEGRRRREEERARGVVFDDPAGESDELERHCDILTEVQRLKEERGEVTPQPEENENKEDEEEEDPMAAMMGFGGFGSTKVGLHDERDNS